MIFSTLNAISAIDENELSDSLNLESSNIYSSNNVYINENQNNIDNNSINEINNDYFSDFTRSENSNNSKLNTSIESSDIDLYFKNGSKFIALLSDESGLALSNQTIIFDINGMEYERITNSSGYASMTINLLPGYYQIKVIFNGNDIYNETSSQNTINIRKTISGEDIIKYYLNDTHYYATFFDNNGNPLANRNVTFNINGVFYTRLTNANGVARLSINLNPDEYTLTAIHPDTELMESNTVKVLSTILSNDLSKVYLDGNQYYASFLDGDGKPLINTDVSFNINGVFYTRTTNASGVARLNINLNPNNYILTAIHPKDNLMRSFNVNVLSNAGTYIKVNSYNGWANLDNTIDITLYDSLDHTLSNQIIYLTINNEVHELTTNSEGIAKYNFNLEIGNHSISLEFKGTNTYSSSKNSSYINLIAKNPSYISGNDTIVFYQNNENFSVLLVDNNKTPMTNKEVYFTINGVDYKRYTDENGIASIKINLQPDNYIIHYKFNGTDYSPSTGSNNLTIVESGHTNFISGDTTIIQGLSEKFQITLNVNGVPIINEMVTFTINGVDYIRYTDMNGIASMAINLLAGVYNISYKYEGNSKLNSIEGSTKLTILKLVETTLNNYGSIIFYVGEVSSFLVILTDINGNTLSDMDIIFTVNGVEYGSKTDSNGIAALNINLNTGTYTILYRFDRTNSFFESSGSQEIVVQSKSTIGDNSNANGYWVFGRDMYNVDLATLSANGIGNVFLNFYAITTHGRSAVESWIGSASNYNIKVHIWMQAFYEGSWIRPVNDDGSYKYDLFNTRIAEAVSYANINGVAGIHLDYLRFPGYAYNYPSGTQAINEFVRMFSEELNSINPNLILSAAVMPETTGNAYNYGQDVSVLGRYLDVIIPMVYKGNYGKGTDWITATTNWFVLNSAGAQVWTGLQGYRNDNDVTNLPVSELSADAQAVLNGGGSGSVIFRFGVSNIINFNDLTNPSSGGDSGSGDLLEFNDILSTASYLKEYIADNDELPESVTVGNKAYLTSQFVYLMAVATVNINNNNFSQIKVVDVIDAPNPQGDIISSHLLKDEYLDLANRVANFIINNGQVPNYASSDIGKIISTEITDALSRILTYYKENDVLPNQVSISQLGGSSKTISELAESLTAGMDNELAKATALFNYVRDHISYKFYYDTRYGAESTLALGIGNCCDMAHLLVALSRASDLTIRYVHGYCIFSGGNGYGHVWCEVLIDGTWYFADTTSSKNSFGVIRNWNTNTATIYNRHTTLPF